jgi:hypothetical protein
MDKENMIYIYTHNGVLFHLKQSEILLFAPMWMEGQKKFFFQREEEHRKCKSDRISEKYENQNDNRINPEIACSSSQYSNSNSLSGEGS